MVENKDTWDPSQEDSSKEVAGAWRYEISRVQFGRDRKPFEEADMSVLLKAKPSQRMIVSDTSDSFAQYLGISIRTLRFGVQLWESGLH